MPRFPTPCRRATAVAGLLPASSTVTPSAAKDAAVTAMDDFLAFVDLGCAPFFPTQSSVAHGKRGV